MAVETRSACLEDGVDVVQRLDRLGADIIGVHPLVRFGVDGDLTGYLHHRALANALGVRACDELT